VLKGVELHHAAAVQNVTEVAFVELPNTHACPQIVQSTG